MRQPHYRPIDLGRAAGISTATVRLYEREGFLPPVEYSPSGHRRFRQAHLDALLASRALMAGYGWQYARRVMRAVHSGDLAAVTALVDARHAELHRAREEVRVTVTALQEIAGNAGQEGRTDGMPHAVLPMSIGQAARWANVAVSSLRFWEDQGLLNPARAPRSAYRRYDRSDLRQVRIVVVLRQADYRFEDIRRVLNELGARKPDAALEAVQKRQQELADAGLACMAATAALWGYVARLREEEEQIEQ